MMGVVALPVQRRVDMRIGTPEQLRAEFAAFPGRPRAVVSGNAATPWTLLRLFDEAVDSYVLHLLNPHPGVPDRPGVGLETAFVGPGARRSPQLSYVPTRLSMLPLLYSDALAPDVVLLRTSVPRDGAVSMGIEVNVLPAAVEAVRDRGGVVVCQLDPSMPYTFGDGELPTDHVDWAVEASDVLGSPRASAPDAAAEHIAEQVAGQIADGATIQIGIGEVPDAVVGGLMRRRELRVWSEMISDGVLALERAGRLDRDVPISASFLFGSPELYQWADQNPRLRLLRTETTNAPALIARNPAMVSINTAYRSTSSPRSTPRGSRAASTVASVARPTSSSERCTLQAGRRSSLSSPGMPEPMSPPSCRWWTSR
jgi:hypothetical protein